MTITTVKLLVINIYSSLVVKTGIKVFLFTEYMISVKFNDNSIFAFVKDRI